MKSSKIKKRKSPRKNTKDNLIFGYHSVLKIIDTAPSQVLEMFIAANSKGKRLDEITEKAKLLDIPIMPIDKNKLDEWLQDQNHQGVALRVKPQPDIDESCIPDLIKQAKNPLVLALDGIQDPQNLGACLRVADACGVTAVIAPKDKSCSLTPVVKRVACGAAENITFIRVTNLSRTLQGLQSLGLWIIGTGADSEKTLYDLDLSGPIALVIGSEDLGLRRLTKKYCDYLASLPMLGTVESLNAAVSSGVCLYEAIRQRT